MSGHLYDQAFSPIEIRHNNFPLVSFYMEVHLGQDGLIRDNNNHCTSANDLFSHLSRGGQVTDCSGSLKEITFSKRPAKLTFSLELSDTPKFKVFLKETPLRYSALNTATGFGYFIIESRLYFLSEDQQTDLKTSQADCSLIEILKLVRKFKTQNKLNNEPDNIVVELNKAQRVKDGSVRLFEKELYPYQKQGIDWLSFCTRNGLGTILADDMGLGKTAQIIALICDTLAQKINSRILIVVPNPLLENWCREFSFFAPRLKPYVHYGPNRRGLPDELVKHQIIISPYTTVALDISLFEDMVFDLTLFDEASMLKNPDSSRTIAAKRINSKVKIAMTGTPVENSLIDAWSLSDLVFPGYLGSKKDFTKQYVSNDIGQVLKNNLNVLESSLGQITLRRMKKDVLKQLPKKKDTHIPISMSHSENKNYESLINEIKKECDSGGNNILALINKLQQFTAHPAQLNKSLPRDFNSLKNHSSKFEVLFMRLEKIFLVKEKVLIFAIFQDTIDLIADAIEQKFGFKCGKIDGRTPNNERQTLIDELEVTEGFGALILHPRTAGMGFNITCANNVIHYSRQWNPALEEQATARAWRNGQTQIVNVYYLFFANTIEEEIDLRLRLKQELSDRVVTISENKETDKTLILNYLAKLEEV